MILPKRTKFFFLFLFSFLNVKKKKIESLDWIGTHAPLELVGIDVSTSSDKTPCHVAKECAPGPEVKSGMIMKMPGEFSLLPERISELTFSPFSSTAADKKKWKFSRRVKSVSPIKFALARDCLFWH